MQILITRHRKTNETIDGSLTIDGTFICPGCLKHSRAAFDTLYERLRKSIERGNEVTLKIINA